jgi:predicted dehydrogenase
MMRVALNGVDEATCREISLRLRGAIVSAFAATSDGHGPTTACDAVAFLRVNAADLDEIERCLAAGKHVLLAADARPLCDRLERLTNTSRQAGAQLSVVNADHALPSRQLIRQQIASGKLGEVGLVRIHRWEPSASDFAPSRNSLPGPLINDVELALWLFDKSPDVVYAIEQTANEQAAASGDLMQVHLGFPGGGMALINYSNRLPPGDGYQSLSVIGSTGAAYADDHQDRQLFFAGGPPQAVRGGEGITLAPLMQEFVDALRDQRDLSVNLSAWTRAWAVADAVERSIESRQAIHREND